ncbi:retrovirus-related pol polyprotein from transposon TNT 1-94 [Tanacetum coccineum]
MADSAWIRSNGRKNFIQFDKTTSWELDDKPFWQELIKLKWIWKNQKDVRPNVIRNKSMTCSKGFMLREDGIDFENHCSSCSQWRAVMYFYRKFCTKSFPIYQMDVKTAFLNGPLKEEVYVMD